jgi:hypothetical protein
MRDATTLGSDLQHRDHQPKTKASSFHLNRRCAPHGGARQWLDFGNV